MKDFSRLKSRARRLTSCEADAEDLCHDVWLAYFERALSGAKIDRPLPYMMTSLRHAAHARHRSGQLQEQLEEEDAPAIEDASLSCYCAEVLARMEHLPSPERALLKRVAYEGIGPSELASELNIPVGTVMSRLSRARAKLRKSLECCDD